MVRIATTDRRAALLAAAVRVIARDGVAHASIRDIAAEAGMPVASFHYVFASRDAMLRELVESLVVAQAQQVHEGAGAADDLPGFVRAALLGWLERAAARPEVEVVLHELLTWSRWAPGMDDLAAAIYRHYEQVVLAFVEVSRLHFGARWARDDAAMARLVLVVTDGVAARWLVDRDDGAARAMLELGAGFVLAQDLAHARVVPA